VDGHAARTRRNVEHSDGTLILRVGPARGGTALTLQVCRELHRPVTIMNAELISATEAGAHAQAFAAHLAIQRLNVAGPRASQWPGGYAYAREVVRRLCSRTDE
jgi:Circularly permutated YpsA SLOG family